MADIGVSAPGPGEMMGNAGPGMLAGIRVIEVADERAEYTGLLLAGLGAEVIKIEPREGNPTRRIGPFLKDQPGLERSLFFWNYNRNKKSLVLDLHEPSACERLLHLLDSADVLLDASCGALNAALGLERAALSARFPRLVTARMTPFGDDGPWRDLKGSDLIHLALGGVMMNCGYDPDPNLDYDTPPIAPQVWHAYHIAGEQLATGIIAALIHRHRSGEGQDISLAVHEAVSKNPEQDIMYWVMRRVPLWRLTNRHAAETPNHSPGICHTKDGRWFITHGMGARDLRNLVPLLSKYGMQADLQPPPPDADLRARQVPGTATSDAARAHMLDIVQRFTRAWTYADMPWREAQDAGLLWAPLRKPHENALDEHWLARKTFADVPHPEQGRSYRYPTSKWLSNKTSWQVGRRAPLLGEDTAQILGEAARRSCVPATPRAVPNPRLSALHNKPFPLQGVRNLDFAWFVASAGALDFWRQWGRKASKSSGRTIRTPGSQQWRRSAAGLRATPPPALCQKSEIRHGRPVQQQECRQARHILEYSSPQGIADRQRSRAHLRCRRRRLLTRRIATLGSRLRRHEERSPDVIYIQQSGMGARRAYGRMRTVGPLPPPLAGRATCQACPNRRCRSVGVIRSRLDGRLRLCAGLAWRTLPLSILDRIGDNNRKRELLLTDALEIARSMKLDAAVVDSEEDDVRGINTKAQLAEAEAVLQQRLRKAALEAGVTMVAPETVFLVRRYDCSARRRIEPYVVFGDKVTSRRRRVITPSRILTARMSARCSVGPFARLRPGTRLGEGARIAISSRSRRP